MQSCAPFPLTLALSLRELVPTRAAVSEHGRVGSANQQATIPPAPEPRKHPTSNIERPASNNGADTGHWMFEVGCWMLDVLVLRFRGPVRKKVLSWDSTSEGEGRGEGEC